MIKVGDKYKIKPEYRKDIFLAFKMAGDENVLVKDINGVWEIHNIPKYYNNKDLSYMDLGKVMFIFKKGKHYIGIYLSEVTKYKEKNKISKNQLKII